jgi:TM2 domain-containing membrane protein YozV
MRLCFFSFLLVLTTGFSQAQDIYTVNKSKEFASYLFKSGQYELSASEYERLLFLDKSNDSLKLALVNSYFNNGELERAVNRAESLYPVAGQFTNPMADLYLQMLIIGKQFDKFDEKYDKLPIVEQKKSLYELHREVMAGNWSEVETKIPQVGRAEHPSVSNLKVLSTKANAFKHKKAWVAVIMSAILPGSGKFYTGDFKDGIFSFLVVGGTAFQAYRGFNQSGVSSTSGWIFASIATGFYAGNIYGSAKSAQVYNQNFWFEIEKDAESIIRSSY